MTATIRVHVITFRRPLLLKRCLESVRAQTFADWTLEVLNDDPSDGRVAELIRALDDPRIRLSEPCIHRGATANFNHAFRPLEEPFASILEDDNWWEPGFLATMLAALERHPDAELACGNERLWTEEANGSWTDTRMTIWPEHAGEALFFPQLADLCGRAKLCNSSLLYRTRRSAHWRTPNSIPVDVTEHFRERVVSSPFLLVHAPLTNYAVTRQTARSNRRDIWGGYQLLLVGSVFSLLPPESRRALAASLFSRLRPGGYVATAGLLGAGFLIPEAGELWRQATPREKLRFVASSLRHPGSFLALRQFRLRHRADWSFLVSDHAGASIRRFA